MPGESPPEVKTPIFLMFGDKKSKKLLEEPREQPKELQEQPIEVMGKDSLLRFYQKSKGK